MDKYRIDIIIHIIYTDALLLIVSINLLVTVAFFRNTAIVAIGTFI